MAGIVVIHGIGQEMEGSNTLHARHFPALRDGMSRAGTHIDPGDVAFASYGELFRPAAEFLAPTPYYDDSDVESGYEEDLLLVLWERAASCDQAIIPPDEEVLARTPSTARRALAALSRSRFLAGITERSFIGDLKQVRTYFCDEKMRADIQKKVTEAITDDTRVVVGHSLGSVAAYEVLFTQPHRGVQALVTLGSPLGLRNLVFDRLRPTPVIDAGSGSIKGAWPPVAMWANVADIGDVVAAVEDLRPLFGEQMRQLRVHNGAAAHDMNSYLTDPKTGQLISVGLHA
jgi:pimeloyl-ACP methyl ester carboxylesterase